MRTVQQAAQRDDRVPVVVLTGFLGAGKTTLLNRVLSCAPDNDTLVLINEYGEEGIDHHLVSDRPGEQVLLPAGCVCCSVRGDLVEALEDAIARRRRSELRPFARVVLETTGVADPTPIVATLSPASPLAAWFRLVRVVTCVSRPAAALEGRHHRPPPRRFVSGGHW